MKCSATIIRNFKSQNHLKELLNISKMSDELIIVSPFLADDVGLFLHEMSSIKKIIVYTVFEGYNDALNKAESLLKLHKYCENNEIDLSIRINDDLHAKMYLFYNCGKEVSVIITSANFTSKGLVKNYEWGVLLNNVEHQNRLRSELEEIPVSEINISQLEIIYLVAEDFKKKNPVTPEKKFKINKFINIKPSKSGNTTIAYYLKPIGTTKDPFIKGRTLKENDEIGFGDEAKTLKKGDILICHSVGPGLIVGYYKIVSDKSVEKKTNYEDRWPWKFRVECNSIPFSQRWWVYDMKTNDLVDEFRRKHPDKHITAAGGYTIGALQFGNDKLRLTNEFAAFLIDKIDEKWKEEQEEWL